MESRGRDGEGPSSARTKGEEKNVGFIEIFSLLGEGVGSWVCLQQPRLHEREGLFLLQGGQGRIASPNLRKGGRIALLGEGGKGFFAALPAGRWSSASRGRKPCSSLLFGRKTARVKASIPLQKRKEEISTQHLCIMKRERGEERDGRPFLLHVLRKGGKKVYPRKGKRERDIISTFTSSPGGGGERSRHLYSLEKKHRGADLL